MPPNNTELRSAPYPLKRPRQDPVSCQFCRSKKLKCNRQVPCSNCSARGLSCDGKFTPHPRAPPESVEAAGELSILARLKRLEDIVVGSGSADSKAKALHASKAPTGIPLSPDLACQSPGSEYQEAVQSLEETGAREAPWAAPQSLDIRIMSTHQISIDHDRLFHLQPASRTLRLPPKGEATLLLDHYFKYIDLLQHVIHVPTVQTTMHAVYANLESGLPVIPSDVVLLLAILATATALCTWFPADLQPLISPSDAAQASVCWANLALEVLEFSRRAARRRLAEIQASVILGFLLFVGEGFSTRTRCLFASAVAMARDLSLHKIDAPANHGPGSPNQGNTLETEIKRRVWWHVVASDWIFALSGGSQEGTYLIQPRHFRVNMPLNVDDEDLEHETSPDPKPLSEPTVMSYYIQRIKFADLCRVVVDTMPITNFELNVINYQDVINLDRKFEAYLQDLPVFFKLDEHSVRASEPIMQQRPHIQVQRYVLGMLAQTRRCKLHQPFLIRRSVAHHYDYSRRISLESARSVIRIREVLKIEERSDLVFLSARHTYVVYHVFMALIVLVMDLCFNKAAEGEDDAARKAEVVAACKMLEETKSQSNMASNFLESLMDVLRKHKVRLHNHNPREEHRLPPQQQDIRVADVPTGPSHSPLGNVTHSSIGDFAPAPHSQQELPLYDTNMTTPQQPPPLHDTSIAVQDISQQYLSDFDTIWKEYVELGPKMDVPGWDSLFSDLDSKF